MNTILKTPIQKFSLIFFCTLLLSLASCNDEYPYLQSKPDWMGENIYATLQKDPRFTTYVKLLQKLDPSYLEVLSKTGSRTLFVPTDEAFARFFADNPYHITGIEDMSIATIKIFLGFNTLENAFVSSVLGSSEGPIFGNCLRRYTTMVANDTIPFVSNMPDNPQFARFKDKGLYLTSPGNWTMVHFTQPYFDRKKITNEDYNFWYPGSNRVAGDIHLFGAKLIQKDIVNTNGYIHVVDKVEMPAPNMYEYIREKSDVTVFRKLLERFCEPVYNPLATNVLAVQSPNRKDSVFTISFFDSADRTIVDEYGNKTTVEAILFSPASNGAPTLGNVGGPPSDMPAMLIPTDAAMNNYLKESYLSDYGTWDNVPSDIAAKFVKTHMKRSFLNCLPSNITKSIDDVKGDLMGLTLDNIKKTQMCRNGVVYMIDKVVPPRDFVTVVAPLYKNPQTKILNWYINEAFNNKKDKFNYYLTSLENKFTVFVPVDESFLDYVDPVYQGAVIKRKLKFKYDTALKGVNFIYTDMNGDSIASPPKPSYTDPNNATLLTIQNRLKDILDYHIVVGDIASDQTYVQTKGGAYFKIIRNGGTMQLQGMGDIEQGTFVNVIEKLDISNNIKNGTVYFIDKRIEHTNTSMYHYLLNKPECKEFYSLLNTYSDPDQVFFTNLTTFKTAVRNYPEFLPQVFYAKDGVDNILPFLGLYDYTLFVPTDEAIAKAVAKGVFKSIDEIKALPTDVEKIEAIKKVITFLKNHFVDKSIFTKKSYQPEYASDFSLPREFTTSAKNQVTKRFYKLTVDQEGQTLIVKNKNGQVLARTLDGEINTVTRQYRFASSTISTNSRAVIHLIDNVLPINE